MAKTRKQRNSPDKGMKKNKPKTVQRQDVLNHLEKWGYGFMTGKASLPSNGDPQETMLFKRQFDISSTIEFASVCAYLDTREMIRISAPPTATNLAGYSAVDAVAVEGDNSIVSFDQQLKIDGSPIHINASPMDKAGYKHYSSVSHKLIAPGKFYAGDFTGAFSIKVTFRDANAAGTVRICEMFSPTQTGSSAEVFILGAGVDSGSTTWTNSGLNFSKGFMLYFEPSSNQARYSFVWELDFVTGSYAPDSKSAAVRSISLADMLVTDEMRSKIERAAMYRLEWIRATVTNSSPFEDRGGTGNTGTIMPYASKNLNLSPQGQFSFLSGLNPGLTTNDIQLKDGLSRTAMICTPEEIMFSHDGAYDRLPNGEEPSARAVCLAYRQPLGRPQSLTLTVEFQISIRTIFGPHLSVSNTMHLMPVALMLLSQLNVELGGSHNPSHLAELKSAIKRAVQSPAVRTIASSMGKAGLAAFASLLI